MDLEVYFDGMSGGDLIDIQTRNVGKITTTYGALATALASKIGSTDIKGFKITDGTLYYTLETGSNPTWLQPNANTWGSITGTLTNQTDLKNALDAKASASEVSTLSNTVTSLSGTVGGNTSSISTLGGIVSGHTTSIGELQSAMLNKIASSTIKGLRLNASNYLEYTLNNISWTLMKVLADLNWGSIGGTLANQTDLTAALNAKVSTTTFNAHATSTSNPHSVTKAQVGLGNVDNTSDADKPISTATQAELTALDDLITGLQSGKVSNLGNVTGVQKISLEQWNAGVEAGTLVSTVLYLIEY